MKDIEEHAKKVLDSLARSVREALERKRRLGQYAVIWQDGKVVRLFDEDSPHEEDADRKAPADQSDKDRDSTLE